ncbi:MAG: ribonuclease R [Glaciecola sp.]|jgi:ribonuclease R|uniref:ribonuclease R n=1 Tax=Congregibacter sp. TaxID=2744308 RepID=UPI0039E55D17
MSKQRKPRNKPSDPHAGREAERYDHPIASREAIMDLLRSADGPLSNERIASSLELSDERDLEALRRRLRAMQRDGQLHVDRRGAYGLVEALNLLRCRVQGHRDGYGFAQPETGEEDLYLNAREMRSLFDGDTVLVAVTGVDSRGRSEGKIVEVLERGVTKVVGRYQEESGIGVVLPDNARINQEVLIPPKFKGEAKHGQIVTVEITHYPEGRLGAKGRITEVLGEHLDPGLEIDISIRSHGIPFEWPDAVLDEAGALSEEPEEGDKKYRIDLRKKPFVTIDGEDARDFDDAVYCEKRRLGGWRLWVAIADVSHYVSVGSALDKEAIERGNSVYFPERVVPMLPEVLSNGLCSLKPEVDRLALAVEMEISKAGELKQFRFCEALIHSHARLTYTQVAEVLDGGSSDAVPGKVVPHLEQLHALYKVLRLAREERGAIDFETVETRIIFNAERKIDAIVPVQRNDAHKLIEECMLCANVAAARFFERHELPVLYRVHQGPNEKKLENLRAFLGELGLGLRGGLKPTPEDYQLLIEQISTRDDAHIVQTMLLRSLSQAVYQAENLGHFGLNYPGYAHFTSPIRRYPDLLIHRAIRSVIRSRERSKLVQRVRGASDLTKAQIYPYDEPAMAAFGTRCSLTERRADEATREVNSWLKCEYLREHVGTEFEGVVSAVTGFGLFVELNDLYIEGLVHVTSLPGDYYRFDPAQQRLVGERTGRSFQLGAAITVLVAAVNLDERKIDLEPVTLPESRKRKGSGGGAGKSAAKVSGKPPRGGKAKDKAKPEPKPKPKSKSKAKPGSRSRSTGGAQKRSASTTAKKAGQGASSGAAKRSPKGS